MSDEPSGLVLIDKPAGWTSHDAVGRVRRLARTRKVGHAGTLDPMATGLLLLGVGGGTRLLTYLVGLSKTYTATVRLGLATTTDDADGEPVGSVRPAAGLDEGAIEHAMAGLRGEIEQVPSSVSAIKVDGRRAYARVRAGEDVQLASRRVRVDRFETVARRESGDLLDLDVVVECSSGTYVRALARDLGARLDAGQGPVGGHLTALRRTRVGPFRVEDAVVPPPRGDDDHDPSELRMMGLGQAASSVLPVLRADDALALELTQGKRPEADGEGRRAVLDRRERLVGIADLQDGRARSLMIVPQQYRS